MKLLSLSPFLLLITKNPPYEIRETSCISRGYYGSSPTGKYSFYALTEANCIGEASYMDAGHIIGAIPDPRSELVWFEQVEVDDVLLSGSLESHLGVDLIRSRVLSSNTNYEESQRVMGAAPIFDVVHQSQNAVLVRMDCNLARHVDSLLPPYWKSMVLPNTPISFIPVPSAAVERVQNILSHLKFDPVVASIANNISILQLREDITFLTGEDPRSPIVSRHSFSDGARIAAGWLKDQFEEAGASCTLEPFLIGFAPNVICSYSSTVDTTETILLSSHYDSRGSFGSLRAPGGDDDGSGTVGLLSIARVIKQLGITFKKNVQFVTFAGEEQGLLGSRAYARILREKDADLTFVIQADMTGYHKPDEPLQLGLPATIGTAEVAQLLANVSALYSPDLVIGITNACCSDHQSLHEQGFPATQVFERNGPIVDPMYHNSGDVSNREGYDFEQIRLIAIAEFATLLHAAGFDVPHHSHFEA